MKGCIIRCQRSIQTFTFYSHGRQKLPIVLAFLHDSVPYGLPMHRLSSANFVHKTVLLFTLVLPLRAGEFIGAPEPPKSPKSEPLAPEEERAAFTLPPGFEIELVAGESEGIGKFVTVDWDLQGRMWSMTDLEYPVDAN